MRARILSGFFFYFIAADWNAFISEMRLLRLLRLLYPPTADMHEEKKENKRKRGRGYIMCVMASSQQTTVAGACNQGRYYWEQQRRRLTYTYDIPFAFIYR